MAERIIDIPLKREFETVELYPISDTHIGDPRTDLLLLRRFIDHIKSQENRFVILNGDLVNNAIKSSVSNVYEEIIPPREQKKVIIKELEPIKDRILCVVSGNHEYRTKKESDQDVTEWIADKLGKGDVYKEDDALLKITFGKVGGRENKRQCYTIYVTHGNGGGKRPGSSLNNLELLGLSVDADIYIIGHTHKRIAYKSVYRRPDLYNNKIKETERLFISSAAYQEFGGYPIRKMLNPGGKGSVPVILYGREKRMEAII